METTELEFAIEELLEAKKEDVLRILKGRPRMVPVRVPKPAVLRRPEAQASAAAPAGSGAPDEKTRRERRPAER